MAKAPRGSNALLWDCRKRIKYS